MYAETVNQCHTCSLTGDKLFLNKATEIADKLMPAFKSPTGVPYALVNMRTGSEELPLDLRVIHLVRIRNTSHGVRILVRRHR